MSELLISLKFRLMLDCWTQAGILGVLAECGCGARLNTSLYNEELREVRNLISLGDAESPCGQNTLKQLN